MITSVNAANVAYAGGMKGSNTPAANRDALQAAVNTGRCVHIPFGTFPLVGPIHMQGAGQIVFGQGPFQTILLCSGSDNIFVSNARNDVGIRDMLLRGAGDLTGGFAIVLDGVPSHGSNGLQAWGGDIKNVIMDQMWSGVYARDVNTVTIFDLNMQNMHGELGICAQALTTTHRVDCVRLTHVAYSPSAAARAAGRGEGLMIDGCIHTVRLNDVALVAPYRGIRVSNSAGMPFGTHASFLFANNLEIDFPVREAVMIDAIDRCRFSNSYLHGSQQTSNVTLGSGVRDAKFVNCNLTSAWQNGLVFDGYILDVTATEFDWCSQEAAGGHSGILLANNAQDVRVVGGGGDGSRAGWGIYRSNPNTIVQLAAADAHRGTINSRNF